MDDESPDFDPPTLDLPGPGQGQAHGQAGSDSASSLRNQPLPLQDWDRYTIVEFLGAGGMGTVYKARDPRLNRFVALKFIRDSDAGSDLVQRFNREARAQASIDHEHICKIYEVGEVENRPYISMQYIEGDTLTAARDRMTLPHKVKVVKEVAEALHAAHRHGLIHRDVKPGNVMVEQTQDGGWRPYVLDFGLADEIQTSRASNGAREGTPAYMSPEQARGETQLLDRRSDVYSLGATLYDMLCGQPPHGKGTNEEVLLALLVAEPKPLRQIKRSIPSDLETIVMKCIEKDPAERYVSSKALADDLQRYLDGEPIMAHPAGFVYRLGKKAAKNKLMVATLTIATVTILVLTGTGIRARVAAAEQARQAQQFGQTIKYIEMFLRYAYALPLHDTRIEKKVIRDRMASISERMQKMDGEAAATAHYALGRGYLALQEYEHALVELQEANDGGLRVAEVEYALGRTLGELYYKQFKEVQRRSGQRRDLDKAKIDKQFLEPALYHLRQSGDRHGESRPFAEGLLAYYSQQYDEALKKAQEALTQEPWIYEAKKLQADVYYVYGRNHQNHGQYEEGRADYRRAAELYHEAAEMARSDSNIHGAEADMWVQVMDVDKTTGLSPKEAFERALAACDRAIVSNPENDSAVRKKVWAFNRWAEFQASHGEDPRAAAQQAIDAAQQAVRLNSRNAFPYDQMGLAYLAIARYESDHGLNTSDSEKHAADAFQKSVEVNPNFAWAWNDFGMLHLTKAEWLAHRGEEYRNELEASITKLRRAIEAEPDYHVAYSNLVDVYTLLARYEMDHGRSPEPWIEKATETSSRSLQVNPNYSQTYVNIASIYALRSQYEVALGKSPQAPLSKAIEELTKAVKANPNDAETHRVLAEIYSLSASDLLEHHRDAEEPITKGLQAIQRSILISPNVTDSYILQVRLLLQAAQGDVQRSKSPLQTLQQAQGAATRAHDLNAKDPAVYMIVAEIARATAEWDIEHHHPAQAEITEGLTAVEQAIAINAVLAPALALRGGLHLLMARIAVTPVARKQSAELAVASLRQALSKNPLLDRSYGALLGEAAQLAR